MILKYCYLRSHEELPPKLLMEQILALETGKVDITKLKDRRSPRKRPIRHRTVRLHTLHTHSLTSAYRGFHIPHQKVHCGQLPEPWRR